jgi:hypothetical protein
LFVRDFLEPVDVSAVDCFLYRDVPHCGRWRGTMPMLFARGDDDHVARPKFLDRSAPTLNVSPAVTINLCPSGCVCHADRAHGSNATAPALTR